MNLEELLAAALERARLAKDSADALARRADEAEADSRLADAVAMRAHRAGFLAYAAAEAVKDLVSVAKQEAAAGLAENAVDAAAWKAHRSAKASA